MEGHFLKYKGQQSVSHHHSYWGPQQPPVSHLAIIAQDSLITVLSLLSCCW